MGRTSIIIGAGPAGLTAAYELLKRTDIKPIVLEKSDDIGGISKTVNYKGNRIDIGGHRFFSKSDRVMKWWLDLMPIEPGYENLSIKYRNQSRELKVDPSAKGRQHDDKVMLVRERLSRIYFLRRFFNYPLQLSLDTLKKLGVVRVGLIMASYLKSRIFPRRPVATLEDYLVNSFGKELYKLFFKDYTEKVWGVPCDKISAEWGAQRIKGVSISKALSHAIRSIRNPKAGDEDIAQKNVETSLIERFLYPKFGPGQLWEEVARQIQEMGGTILKNKNVTGIVPDGNRIKAIETQDAKTGLTQVLEGDFFFSTMPVQELVLGLRTEVPAEIRKIAAGLQYRDFLTVGILLDRLSHKDGKSGKEERLTLKDTWIYIQEREVKVGRLQLFNNWSPYLVKNEDQVWLGMEYFCNKDEPFWNQTDAEIIDFAIGELELIGLALRENVLDATVLRMEKTYPAYFGTYERFDEVREYLDGFSNLFLIGRNGMHKYNNSDHSMLTAMTAVDNICAGSTDKANIWSINTEQEYHEEDKNK